MTYAVELRTVYGRRMFCVVIIVDGNVGRSISRSDTHADATLICNALNKEAK